MLQEGEVERLGSARTIKVDVRVIAATNKNLEEEIEKGQLPRGSLFPAGGDPDSRAAAARAARRHPAARPALHGLLQPREQHAAASASRTAALEALQRYRWKGNIRELRNTVERLIIMTGGDTIDVADLPERRSTSPLGGRRAGGAPTAGRRDADAAKARDAPRVQGQLRARLSGRASCARTAGTSRRPPK